jgi:hypothetical protein
VTGIAVVVGMQVLPAPDIEVYTAMAKLDKTLYEGLNIRSDEL